MALSPAEIQARPRRYQALLAPGTPLREGLERILHGRTGALVVLGSNRKVDRVSTGGFALDVQFTPTALRELAKMDGGIILSSDFERILAAGVHFVPDGSIPTVETGTRHRTADRIAQQTGMPVVTVSASMSTIALFLDGQRHPIETSEAILSRANQALATLTRYRERLSGTTRSLSTLEVHDQVSLKDVALVAQRIEMIRRLDRELRAYVAALGVDGRLLEMQLYELTLGVDDLATLLELDYRPEEQEEMTFRVGALEHLDSTELLDPHVVARQMGFGEGMHLETRLEPRGHRQVAQLTRIPGSLGRRLVDHFGTLQALFGASTVDLLEVEGFGEGRARLVREGLARLAEAAFSERLD
ncbi:DNA integrity scanning diadenylate cyclase DisA [Luteococcus japonicus]|uniref:DNA integrity scanning protein disA n=1 Tax=Luteococcus japonicus LSP_Lj1 TaxID=1255658 RepID=A0A1R4IEU9_9ACTN|nr:DNA integrity scanning diadenylate cyclase DisA [Luteococcus japonicus]SJN17843.1 DNA integrity scanning protein disA [Luteococcus japonicus LSP_Lj1]